MGAVGGKVTGRLAGTVGVRPGGRRFYDVYDLFATNGFNLPITADTGIKWVDLDESLIDIQEYGISWNEDTDEYARIGDLALYPTSYSPGNALLPVHRSIRCCVANDAGEVVYFLDPTNRSYKENGDPSNLDGTDGQVCAYIPKFYSKYEYDSGLIKWSVSVSPKAGYDVDPAFKVGEQTSEYILIGTYPGYVDGSGKLCSISGVLPTTSKRRSEFRAAAVLRGAGWHQYDAAAHGLIQRLMVVEYADFNAQSMIGMGLTQYAAWPGMPQALTGVSDALGNMSGGVSAVVPQWTAATSEAVGDEIIPNTVNNYTYRCTTAGTTGASEPAWPTTIGLTVTDGGVTWECVRSLQHVTFRCIEQFFGHCFYFVDGLNIHNSTANRSRVYYADDPSAYADDTDVGYELVGLAAELDGYGGRPILDARLIYPRDTSGSNATKLCDYHYTYFDNDSSVGWRVVHVGGNARHGADAGPSYWNLNNGSTDAALSIGARLCFRGAGI